MREQPAMITFEPGQRLVLLETGAIYEIRAVVDAQLVLRRWARRDWRYELGAAEHWRYLLGKKLARLEAKPRKEGAV